VIPLLLVREKVPRRLHRTGVPRGGTLAVVGRLRPAAKVLTLVLLTAPVAQVQPSAGGAPLRRLGHTAACTAARGVP
jgi:hypothetical protein